MVDQGAVSDFWAKGDPAARVHTALKSAGLSLDTLSIRDLEPFDHFHARGLPATIDLADRLSVTPGAYLLDIGCGIGGPARYIADRFNCRVSGLDITPGFVAIGNELSRLTGMGERVELRIGDGARLPYADAAFDGAFSQHVTMNVQDRASFFAEAYRVIRPGGFFAMSEHGFGPTGDPIYPLPWANDPSLSFLRTKAETEALLADVGFKRIEIVETGQHYIDGYAAMLAGGKDKAPPILGLHVLGGDRTAERAANSTRSIEEGRTFPIEVVCFKPAELP